MHLSLFRKNGSVVNSKHIFKPRFLFKQKKNMMVAIYSKHTFINLQLIWRTILLFLLFNKWCCGMGKYNTFSILHLNVILMDYYYFILMMIFPAWFLSFYLLLHHHYSHMVISIVIWTTEYLHFYFSFRGKMIV